METIAELILSAACIYFGIKFYNYFQKNKSSNSDVTAISGIGGGLVLIFVGLLFLMMALDIITFT